MLSFFHRMAALPSIVRSYRAVSWMTVIRCSGATSYPTFWVLLVCGKAYLLRGARFPRENTRSERGDNRAERFTFAAHDASKPIVIDGGAEGASAFFFSSDHHFCLFVYYVK